MEKKENRPRGLREVAHLFFSCLDSVPDGGSGAGAVGGVIAGAPDSDPAVYAHNNFAGAAGVRGALKNAARHGKENFQEIAGRCPEGVVVVDHKGTVLYCNPRAALLLGAGDGCLLGQVFNFFLEEGEETEVSIFREDGRPGVGRMRTNGMEWLGADARLVIVQDITEKRLQGSESAA